MATTGGVVEARWAVPRAAVRCAVLLLALCGTVFLSGGCAARQHEPVPAEEEETSIERPAVPLSEETSLSDRIGEVGVVLLVVGVAIGLILLPILLL